MRRRRSHWGWGYEDEQPSADELRSTAAFLAGHLGFGSPDPETPVPLSDVAMPLPRLTPPEALTAVCSTDRYERAAHCYGRSYRDLVRGFRGQFDSPPDVVARPRDEEQLRQVLSWALS